MSTPSPVTGKRKLVDDDVDAPSRKESKSASARARAIALNAMELLMMHLKRCKYLIPVAKRLRNSCVLCHSNEEGSHVSASGVRYDDISSEEWRSIIGTPETPSEQGLGMAAILADLGTSQYRNEPYTLTMLKHEVESYLCRVYTPKYATWYSTVAAGGGVSSHKEYNYVTDEKLMLCAKTESILATFKSILTAYGGFPKDVHRRFIRHPSAPQFLWPVVHQKQLAFVEVEGEGAGGSESREIVCIGYFALGSFAPTFDVELATCRIPDLLTLNARRRSEYDGQPHLANFPFGGTDIQDWLRAAKIRHVFEAKGIVPLGMLEETKTEEFKRKEQVATSCFVFNAALARLDIMRTALGEFYTDKFNDVAIRHDPVELSLELMTLAKELNDALLK
jgi:hypothetical protein